MARDLALEKVSEPIGISSGEKTKVYLSRTWESRPFAADPLFLPIPH